VEDQLGDRPSDTYAGLIELFRNEIGTEPASLIRRGDKSGRAKISASSVEPLPARRNL
jgi:hypothetical protein